MADFFENIFTTHRSSVQYPQEVWRLSHFLLPVWAPGPSQERDPSSEKCTKFDIELQKKIGEYNFS